MKKLIVHPLETPLGIGIASISKDRQAKKQAYIVPSATLIKELKADISKKDPFLLSRIEFLTFDQLTRKLTLNQNQRHLLSSSEQELLVKLAVNQVYKLGALNYFLESINKTGWLHQIELWIGEMKRAGVTAEDLYKLWENETDKLKELAMIYNAYQTLLNQYKLIDHEEPYFNLIKDRVNLNIFYEAIIIEQFHDFSPIQMNVLNVLGDSNVDITVHLSLDNTREELFQWTNNTIEYLSYQGFEQKLQPKNNQEDIHNPISYLSKAIFSKNPEQPKHEILENAHNSIHLMVASGKKQEIEMIASEIKDLFFQDVSINDIAIVAANLNDYYIPLEKIMNKAGIPLQIRKKERLIDNPMIQAIVSILKAFNGFKKDWISMILNPYLTWTSPVNAHHWLNLFRGMGYPMNKKTWDQRFQLFNKESKLDLQEKENYNNAMQQIFHLINRIPKKGNNRQFVHFLSEIESELKVKENLKTQFLNNPTDPISYRDIKAYEALQEIKKELSSLDRFYNGEEKNSFWDWIQSFILVLEKREYEYSQGKIQGISVMSPNQIRGRKFKVVFTLGLVMGEFPRPIKNNWLLPDQDRLPLREKKIFLNTTRDYENQQKYHFYQTITASLDKLYLVYSSKTEEGRERQRSFFIDEIVDLLGEDNVTKKERHIGDLVPRNWEDCVYDKQMINKALIQSYQNTFLKESDTQIISIIISRYKEKLRDVRTRIESEENRWQPLSNYDGALINRENIARVKAVISQKVWSNTRLNEAMGCRFAFFANDILKLTEWEEKEEALNPIEKGDLMHRILQRFFQGFKKETGKLIKSDEKEALKIKLFQIAEEEWHLFSQREYRYLDPIRSEIDYHQLIKSIEKFLDHELSWREKAESYFYPSLLEFSFGNTIQEDKNRKDEVDVASITEIAKLKLINHTLSLRGKIDRIDMNDKGEFVIYDYKSGVAPANKEIKEGLHLQLPLYLLVVEELLGLNIEKAVGVAFYTATNRHNGFWKKELLKNVGLSNRIGSKYTEEEWELWLETVKRKVDKLIDQLISGDFSVLPTKECPRYCSYQHICRKDEKRIKKKMQGGEDSNGVSING